MKNEYNFSKLKKRESIKSSKDLKVSKTVRLDADVLLWLQEKADEEGMGYQTFLNSFLKKSMRSETDKLDEIFRRLKKLEEKSKWIIGPASSPALNHKYNSPDPSHP